MNEKHPVSEHLKLENGICLEYQYQYHTQSKGDTLVFIHAHSVDRRMWEPQIEYFAKKYNILYYDLRGYGHSSTPEEGESFLHAEDLNVLMEHLNIRTAHLIGLSLGSFVALDFLALFPNRVLSVTVASGAIPDPKPGALAPLVTDVPHFKRLWFERLLEGCGIDGNGYQNRLWQLIADWSAWQSTHREPDCILGEALLPKLDTIQKTVPLCVIYGEKDFEGAHRSADRLMEIMPHAECVHLPEAGHFSNMETPEAFNIALEAFLRDRRK